VEWVTTSGRTIDEAQDRALDQLGIDASEAEFEVLSDAKLGLFGRVKEEARIRARVRPAPQRDTDRRRQRDRRSKDRPARDERGPVSADRSNDGASANNKGARDRAEGPRTAPTAGEGATRRSKPAGTRPDRSSTQEGNPMSDELRGVEESKGREFLLGLLDAAGVEGSVDVRRDDDVSELSISGDSLGFLIGPRGTTLAAVQALTRAVAQRDHERGDHRLTVDIGEYAQRRRGALEVFARQVAADVISSGRPKMLDPMVASERKIVHDVLSDVDGVQTSSVGEEPRRSVVVNPA
jgi:spoIIIJ-associated protein